MKIWVEDWNTPERQHRLQMSLTEISGEDRYASLCRRLEYTRKATQALDVFNRYIRGRPICTFVQKAGTHPKRNTGFSDFAISGEDRYASLCRRLEHTRNATQTLEKKRGRMTGVGAGTVKFAIRVDQIFCTDMSVGTRLFLSLWFVGCQVCHVIFFLFSFFRLYALFCMCSIILFLFV